MSEHNAFERLSVQVAELRAEMLRNMASLARVHGDRLTRAEVLKRLGCSPNTLTAYIRTRDFPTPGRDGKWLLAEIVEWEAQK